ncbi:Hypothetical protein DEACI_2681 [Acididesulfobacillus acetoxydans]|uniref:Uncharacterized protein n=1 Tax=Acididesulfobacillus acetoxydans TaxID=1561005 RepID=A0A8S0X5X2_9FIRM|nr:Hypothetical protein DEACI_2681 [Acididesulfobacillus acetoxydans]CEJ08147.1 Hypothetical protein DEACI_2622 [Acididesulfobacillus acetoxydans]
MKVLLPSGGRTFTPLLEMVVIEGEAQYRIYWREILRKKHESACLTFSLYYENMVSIRVALLPKEDSL